LKKVNFFIKYGKFFKELIKNFLMFKKKKISSNKKGKNKNLFLAIIFFIIVIFLLVFLFVEYLKSPFLNKIEFLNFSEKKQEQEYVSNDDLWNNIWEKNKNSKEFINKKIINKKNQDKINFLLLWRWWRLNDAPNLTDTIILLSINTKTKTVSMLSIPRDLYVKFWNDKYWKINKIYAIEKLKYWKQKAILELENKIKEITNEKIDYYIMADFEGFSAFIDAIWWIKITVPKTLVDPKFPDWKKWYRTLIIKKWTWLFDWDVALMYARSRHSTSDFDRSLRQQQIIKAVKEKLNEWWFFSKLLKLKKFYNVFKKYVDTDLDISSILSIYSKVWSLDSYKFLSFNINDSCFFWDPDCSKWWFLYVPERKLYWWASVLLPTTSYLWNIWDYSQIQKYSDYIFNHPEIYKENLVINIFNNTKIRWIAWDLSTALIRYWFNIPKYNSIWNYRKKILTWSLIRYVDNVKNSYTLKELQKITWIKNLERIDNDWIKNKNAQIEIILASDYKNVFKNIDKNLKLNLIK